MARPWRIRFLDLMEYLRQRGWNRCFILDGNVLRAPGMIGTVIASLPHDNDNRRRR